MVMDLESEICLLAWKDHCAPKYRGGLGFKNLKFFNLAVLAKSYWRIRTVKLSLSKFLFKTARRGRAYKQWSQICSRNAIV